MRIFVLPLILGMAGCTYQQTVAPPSTISLEKAMVDTVDALAATRQRGLALGTHFELYACTVTAVFNVSATQTVDNKLAIQAGVAPKLIPISLTGNASNEDQTIGTRGNTVTVVLASDKCSPVVALKGSGTPSAGNAQSGKGSTTVMRKPTPIIPVIPF
jgi:hypothetical protein